MKTVMRIIGQVAFVVSVLFSVSGFAAEKITYYHWDASGSPVAATDEQGNVVWRKSYKPYGEETQTPPTPAESRSFTGHVLDADTGLLYAGARYYDPTIGRFMAVDPANFVETNPHSFNKYAYGNNNPYKYVDPDGRWATFIHQASINRALPFLSVADRQIFTAQQVTIDANQANNVQFRHSLHVPGQTAQQAWEAGNNYVRTELQAARDLDKAGNREAAFERLGNAMHTMQDATSPSHEGFQLWDNDGSYASKANHLRKEILEPGAGSNLDAATARAWHLFRRPQPLPTEILPRP